MLFASAAYVVAGGYIHVSEWLGRQGRPATPLTGVATAVHRRRTPLRLAPRNIHESRHAAREREKAADDERHAPDRQGAG